MSFVVSTDEVDRHGDVVSVNGWRLQSYGRNPVFLWAHDYTQPAIGRAVNMWREEHGLLATMEFAPTVSPVPPSTGNAPSGSRGWSSRSDWTGLALPASSGPTGPARLTFRGMIQCRDSTAWERCVRHQRKVTMPMFGCLFFVFRSIATLILGIVIFFSFLGFLLVDNFRDNFLSTEFYTKSLSDNNVYDRIYDEVLLDQEFVDTKEDLLGDIKVPQQDVVDVARDILSPEHLQNEVERAVEGVIDYLNKETDVPDTYIHLGPPLANAKEALFNYMDRRIDSLEGVPVSSMDELQAELESLYRTVELGDIPERLPFVEDPDSLVADYVDDTVAELEVVPANTPAEFEDQLETLYKDLAGGQLPTSIPSIEAIPIAVRLATYDLVVQAVRLDPSISREAITALEENEEAIKAKLSTPEGDVIGALEAASRPLTGPAIEFFIDDAYDLAFRKLQDSGFSQEALDGLAQREEVIKGHLGRGEIKDAVKVSARALAGPLIDDGLDEIREELDDQERLDLVEIAAKQNNQTKAEFLDEVDPIRDVIDASALDGWFALLVIAVAVIIMGVVHLPHLASSLRWPGTTLFMSGLFFLVAGIVLKIVLSDRGEDLLERGTGAVAPIPPTMITIISDVLTSLGKDVAGELLGPSIIIMVIGVVMIVGSIFIRALHIPFLSK